MHVKRKLELSQARDDALGDHHPLDLPGALEDVEYLDVAEEFLDDVVPERAMCAGEPGTLWIHSTGRDGSKIYLVNTGEGPPEAMASK